MALAHAPMNFRTRTKLAAEQSRKAWCWRSSPASTGRKAAGFAWKIIFGLHKKATKNCALIRTISGWQDRQPLDPEARLKAAPKTTNTLDAKLAQSILAEIREEEIVAMACDVINIPSPTGEELQMALYMNSALKQLGLDVTWQEVEEGRANVVGRWRGSGYGFGTHYLVNHGVLPDMCILGEPTDMHVVLEHFGSMWVRISCTGIYVHTAFCAGREEMNSIRRMHELLSEIMKWISAWENKAAYGGKKAIVNLGGIRGGHACRASRTPEKTDLFLDVRVPPNIAMSDARREVQQVFFELEHKHPDWGLEFETYVSVPGARISEEHEMVKTIEANHQRIMGTPPEREVVTWCSDASVLSRYGIETVNYGPSSGPRDAEGEKVKIQTLVDITKIYALTAAELCGVMNS